jgi:hypothetical protein
VKPSSLLTAWIQSHEFMKKTAQRCIFVKDERDVAKLSVNFQSELIRDTHGPQKLRNLSVIVLGNCTYTCHWDDDKVTRE